jgi:hypothetical protein
MRPWFFSKVWCPLMVVSANSLLLLAEEQLDVLLQGALVAFQRQHVICLFLFELSGDLLLAAHRVDGGRRALQREQIQQIRDRRDLVGFVRHFRLREHQSLTRVPGRDHVDGRLGAALLIRATQGLAVDGHDVPCWRGSLPASAPEPVRSPHCETSCCG